MRFRCGRLAPPPRPAGAVLAREGFRVTAVAPRPWAAALPAALRPFAYGAAGLLGAGACAAALAGDINAKVTDNASLDELLVKIKAELTKLGPILDLEMCGSQRGRTAVERSSTADAQGLEPRHRVSG